MAVHIVRLGSARLKGEGIRIGTVRRPPRGVPKSEYATQNWFDIWLPEAAPSAELMQFGKTADSNAEWAQFIRRYRKEMASPEKSRLLDLLAAFSHHADFSVGCYCRHENHCHRSVLRQLLVERGAYLSSSENVGR